MIEGMKAENDIRPQSTEGLERKLMELDGLGDDSRMASEMAGLILDTYDQYHHTHGNQAIQSSEAVKTITDAVLTQYPNITGAEQTTLTNIIENYVTTQ